MTKVSNKPIVSCQADRACTLTISFILTTLGSWKCWLLCICLYCDISAGANVIMYSLIMYMCTHYCVNTTFVHSSQEIRCFTAFFLFLFLFSCCTKSQSNVMYITELAISFQKIFKLEKTGVMKMPVSESLLIYSCDLSAYS